MSFRSAVTPVTVPFSPADVEALEKLSAPELRNTSIVVVEQASAWHNDDFFFYFSPLGVGLRKAESILDKIYYLSLMSRTLGSGVLSHLCGPGSTRKLFGAHSQSAIWPRKVSPCCSVQPTTSHKCASASSTRPLLIILFFGSRC